MKTEKELREMHILLLRRRFACKSWKDLESRRIARDNVECFSKKLLGEPDLFIKTIRETFINNQ